MTVTPTNYGDNAFNPGMTSDIYTPDQLIAGDAKIVTDSVTITGAANLVRGTVLGQVNVGAGGAAVAGGGNTGNGAISLIAPQGKAKVGNYLVRFTGALTYNVINPNGAELTPGYAGGAYADAELNFTFTAGGTAMVAGDTFTIPVAAGSGSYKQAVATAVDGSQTPCAILADAANAASADVTAGIYLTGEFNSRAITLDGSFTVATAKAALRPFNIFLKTSVPADDPS